MSEDSSQKRVALNLRRFSVEELQAGTRFQRENYGWDFNTERQFMEKLFCQRFNFLMIIYSLFIAAGARASSQTMLTIVLLVGTLLTLMISLTIWRAYVKLIVNLRILHQMPKHAFYYIQAETNALGWQKLFPVNSIIGFWLPIFCTASMALGSLLASLGIIKAA